MMQPGVRNEDPRPILIWPSIYRRRHPLQLPGSHVYEATRQLSL